MHTSPDIKYQAALTVAETVERHFSSHMAAARKLGEQKLAAQPPKLAIREMIDTAFWASLRHEEGLFPKISLAFLSPEQAGLPIRFDKKFPLTSRTLTKLAPGVERTGIYLGVWLESDELYVWGTTRRLPTLCFVVNVSEPGLLVIKHKNSGDYLTFTNVAVLNGEHVKVIDDLDIKLTDCPGLLSSLLGLSSPSIWNESVNILVQLAFSMRAHRHGGALLVVPSHTDAWRESIVHPVSYLIEPPFYGLSELMKQEINQRSYHKWQRALQEAVESVACLTAVDGATLISDKYELIAFGAKIKLGQYPVEQVLVTEPIVDSKAKNVSPSQCGGTRHMSAAQFVHDQHDAVAMVASQDGRFTVFAWSSCNDMVRAHQIESLLL